ncbi:MAG: glycosyltransferase family 9 protein [Phycisphaerales bacterium]|nr:glycosyltransferase family 9 protein [Phycisphaerales bacterium]
MKHILVILPSWVGDVCMATPVLRHLAAHYSNARIVIFGRPMLEPLVAGLPFVDSFIPGSMRGSRALGELRQIRRERFDALLLLPNSFRSAFFGRLTGIPQRIGTARDGRSWLLTRRFTATQRVQSAVDAYAELAEWWTGAPLTDRCVELAVTPSDDAQARALLGESSAAIVRDLILLNPGANRLDKRWPAQSFARAALEIRNSSTLNHQPRRIAVTGNHSESALCAEIAKHCGAIDLCARGVSLGSLKGILSRTALLITNDTGPRSIAAALGTPTIALFGPTDCRWTPLDYPLEQRLTAEPFLTPDCIADDHKALCAIDRISVGDVVAAARALEAQLVTRTSK